MNPLKVAIEWLLKKHVKEENKVSEPLNDTVVDQQNVSEQVALADPAAVANAPVAEPVTPVAEVKTGVQDFEKAFQFVADGVAKLGEGAKDELVALAKKYL